MKKFLSYILILVALVGVFGFVSKQARANTDPNNDNGTCIFTDQTPTWCTNQTGGGVPGMVISNGSCKIANWTRKTCITDNSGNFLQYTGSCTVNGVMINGYGVAQSACAGTWTPDTGTCVVGTTTMGTGWKQEACDVNNANSVWASTSNTSTPNTQSPSNSANNSYTLLQPLPCKNGDANCQNGQITSFNTSSAGGNDSLGTYLNVIIKIFIGICAVLSVVMIVIGGIEYMTSELPGNKEHGKERILASLGGLVLALLAWTLLYTINPNLLSTNFSSMTVATVNVALTTAQQVQNFTGGGTCTPVTDSSSPCSVANLAGYGFAGDASGTQASSICHGESNGNPNQLSGVDMDSNGKPFSFGLFQINAIAHSNIPACANVYNAPVIIPNNPLGTRTTDKQLGSCMQLDPSGKICEKYDISIANQTNYNSCQAYLLNPDNNTTIAAGLLDTGTWKQWGADSSCHF